MTSENDGTNIAYCQNEKCHLTRIITCFSQSQQQHQTNRFDFLQAQRRHDDRLHEHATDDLAQRRFSRPSDVEDEPERDEEFQMSSQVPFLLVATGVRDDWQVPPPLRAFTLSDSC